VGTLALEASAGWERRLLGREPRYAPPRIVRGLLWRWARRVPDRRQARWMGQGLRWAYGLTLGGLHGLVRSALPARGVWKGLVLGAGVLAFETVVMPGVGAVPPLSRWPRKERWLLAAHTALYGLSTELAFSLADARSARAISPAP
jgi:uncharacterized membrane protein YagU involved in acid resistance